MTIDIIKTEITVDPEIRGYAEMTNKQILDDGYIKYRTRNKTSLTGSEILNAFDDDEFFALSTEKRRAAWDVVHIPGPINPFGIEAKILIDAFGAGSITISTLATLRVESISRWEELGINVKEGHVEQARN